MTTVVLLPAPPPLRIPPEPLAGCLLWLWVIHILVSHPAAPLPPLPPPNGFLVLRPDKEREMGRSTRQHKRTHPHRPPRRATDAGHDKKGGLLLAKS